MTRFDDLDRAIDAYFDLEAAAPEPAGLLESVTVATRARRPRPSWLGWIRQGGPTPFGAKASDASRSVLLVALAALLLATVAAFAFVGGQRPPSVFVSQTSPTPSATTEPSAAPSQTTYPIADDEPWIVYMSNIADDGSDRLHLVRPDGSGRHALPTGLDGQQEHPDWSPDGSTIAFERWLTDTTYPQHDRLELWTVRPDGSDATRILDCTLPCLQLSAPAWSPDGRSIAFVRYSLTSADEWGPSALEILDVASRERRTVTTTPDGSTAFYHPRWSPDGTEIVLGLEAYPDARQSIIERSQIAVVKTDGPDGDRPRIIPTDGMDAWAPDWHPTDDRILFHTRFDPSDPAERSTPTDIWVVHADGSGLRNLSDLGLGDLRAIDPTWSPDGMEIVFTQVDGFQTGQIPVVALMDAEGGDAVRLGFSDGTVGRLRPTP